MTAPSTIAPSARIHATATIADDARIGAETRVWHHVHVMSGARIGQNCVIGHASFVGPNAVVGDGCRIQNHVSLFDGVTLEDHVFVGPSAVFTNVKNPRASIDRRGEFRPIVVRGGATIGANATILPGVTLGRWCFVGAGAVVTNDVPDFALVVGAPARDVGWMSRHGERLVFGVSGRSRCSVTGEVYVLEGGRVSLLSPPASG